MSDQTSAETTSAKSASTTVHPYTSLYLPAPTGTVPIIPRLTFVVIDDTASPSLDDSAATGPDPTLSGTTWDFTHTMRDVELNSTTYQVRPTIEYFIKDGTASPSPPPSTPEEPSDTTKSTPAAPSSESSSTTASSAAPDQTGDPPPNDSGKHDDGVLAGAIVGCVVGGILIGAIVAWLLFRRSRKAKNSETAKLLESGGKANAIATSSPPSSIGNAQLEQSLLDTTPDGVIQAELRALDDLINHHVETNYHLSPVAAGVSELSRALTKLGLTQKSETIAIACVRPETRHVALRHVISQTIFTSIDVHCQGEFSMLPPPVAALLQSIPDGQNDTATSLALSEWRRLSAFLLHSNHGDRTPLPVIETAVRPQALILSDALNSFLHHFVAPDEATRGVQTTHLEGIIIECTKLGYILLSQPRDWRFVFESGESDSWVVCAGLDKLGAPDGRARRVVEPTVVRQAAVRA